MEIKWISNYIKKVIDVTSEYNYGGIDMRKLLSEEIIELNVLGKIHLKEERDGSDMENGVTFQIRSAKIKLENGSFHAEVDALQLLNFLD
jgi:hypothetical protein